MKISVFGLGYVGCVSAACMAKSGHEVIGVDVNPIKVSKVSTGNSPVIEVGLNELIADGVRNGRLRATCDSRAAVLSSDVSLICVGTPGQRNGNLRLDHIIRVCEDIGNTLAEKRDRHTVVVRSTVLPGTVRTVIIPILSERSGKRPSIDFGVAMNPEFLRESSAVSDYFNPSLIIIGQLDQHSGDNVSAIYRSIHAEEVRLALEAAEMIKYANNAFHAMKIVFANEIGALSKAHGIDGRMVMDALCRDKKLNISPAYLRPGNAFGGSCLPKDVRALNYRAKEYDVDTPLLSSLLRSNKVHIENTISMVERTQKRTVAVLGLSFKAGTDDVRESATIVLIETLLGRGYQVRVYDEHVRVDCLIGANRTFLETELPHVALLMRSSIKDALEGAGVIVIANDSKHYHEVFDLMTPDQALIDLAGIAYPNSTTERVYDGACW